MSNSHVAGSGPAGVPDGEPPAYEEGNAPAYGAWQGPPSDQQRGLYQAVSPTGLESPDHSRRNLAILGVVGVAVVAVIAIAAVVILRMGSTEPTPGVLDEAPPTPVAQAATDCTHSLSSGEVPTSGIVSAGGLSFPRSVAPDWRPKPEHRVPNSIDAVSLDEQISDMEEMNWIGQLTVGITNFEQSMSLADQAKLMLKCIPASDLYDTTSPTVAEVTPTPGRLDGTPTSTIEAPISVTIPDRSILGDDLVLIIVGTRPTTYFLATTPFGDVDRRAVVQAALDGLHVSAL